VTTILASRSQLSMTADSKVSHGESKFKTTKKIQRAGKFLVGVAGCYFPALACMRAFVAASKGMSGEVAPPLPTSTEDFELLALSRHGLWLYSSGGAPMEVEGEDVYAIGTGGVYAMVSLRTQELLLVPCSLTAAVEVACEYDDNSGLPVVELALK